jgi:sRNA-binding regulator protein Hfq
MSKSADLFRYFEKKYGNDTTTPTKVFMLCWRAQMVSDTEIAFVLQANKNIVVVFDMATGEFVEHFVGASAHSYAHIKYDGENYWLYSYTDDVLVRWNRQTGQEKEIRIADELPEFQPCGRSSSFSNMAVCGEYLYLTPHLTNLAVRVNTMTLDVAIDQEISKECDVGSESIVYSAMCKRENSGLLLHSYRSQCFLRVSGDDEGGRRLPVSLPLAVRQGLRHETGLSKAMANGLQLSEQVYSLEEFLAIVHDERCKQLMQQNHAVGTRVSTHGGNIYSCAKRLLCE